MTPSQFRSLICVCHGFGLTYDSGPQVPGQRKYLDLVVGCMVFNGIFKQCMYFSYINDLPMLSWTSVTSTQYLVKYASVQINDGISLNKQYMFKVSIQYDKKNKNL